jgi:hypothetical protein
MTLARKTTHTPNFKLSRASRCKHKQGMAVIAQPVATTKAHTCQHSSYKLPRALHFFTMHHVSMPTNAALASAHSQSEAPQKCTVGDLWHEAAHAPVFWPSATLTTHPNTAPTHAQLLQPTPPAGQRLPAYMLLINQPLPLSATQKPLTSTQPQHLPKLLQKGDWWPCTGHAPDKAAAPHNKLWRSPGPGGPAKCAQQVATQ